MFRNHACSELICIVSLYKFNGLVWRPHRSRMYLWHASIVKQCRAHVHVFAPVFFNVYHVYSSSQYIALIIIELVTVWACFWLICAHCLSESTWPSMYWTCLIFISPNDVYRFILEQGLFRLSCGVPSDVGCGDLFLHCQLRNTPYVLSLSGPGATQ